MSKSSDWMNSDIQQISLQKNDDQQETTSLFKIHLNTSWEKQGEHPPFKNFSNNLVFSFLSGIALFFYFSKKAYRLIFDITFSCWISQELWQTDDCVTSNMQPRSHARSTMKGENGN